jgi:surfeit locus 1 family protein
VENASPPQHAPLTLTRGGIVGTLLVVAVALTCIRLGFWQLDRLEERRARNSALEERLAQSPLAIAGPLADTAGMSYRRARAEGTFDHDRTIVLPGRSYMGTPGVHVLTPLRLDGSGTGVLVNRGWVPAADAATIDYDAIRTAADTAVEGILLPFPGRRASLGVPGTADPDSAFRRVWYAIDENLLRRQFPYRLVDAQLQLLPVEGERGGLPRPLAPPPLDEGPHRGYAMQWFSFAAIAVIGWIALQSRERRSRAAHERD